MWSHIDVFQYIILLCGIFSCRLVYLEALGGANGNAAAPFDYECYQCSLNNLSNKKALCPPSQTTTCSTGSKTPYCVVASFNFLSNKTHYDVAYLKGCASGCEKLHNQHAGKNGMNPFFCTQCIGTKCNKQEFIPLPRPQAVGLPDVL